MTLALLAPLATSDAQVAFQVKNGTTWTSSLELRGLASITFRWRWDGAETLTGVSWQLATVTPVSTATSRATDVVASDTPMRLPAATSTVKGAYEEFTITPASTWPARFYIRMRATYGRSIAYSRWIPVSVVQRTDVVANPTCTIDVIKGGGFSMVLSGSKTVEPGDKVSSFTYAYQRVRISFKNRLTSPVSYRRSIFLTADGEKDVLYSGDGSDTVRELTGSGTETFEMLLVLPVGTVKVEARLRPVTGINSECSFQYEIVSQ